MPAEDLLCNTEYDDVEHLESSEVHYLCFDMENVAITVIDNMDIHESLVTLVNDATFFNKKTSFKVVTIYIIYKYVDHPKGHEFEEAMPYRLAIEWAAAGIYLDCGLFAMRHMETWFWSNKREMG
ncbi:hypothetical protein Hanom_Chr14g01265911 [Helianthus anomalus]